VQYLVRLFDTHPASVGETYLMHLWRAAGSSAWLAYAAAACLVHAVFPFLFVKTASRIVAKLNADVLALGQAEPTESLQPPSATV